MKLIVCLDDRLGMMFNKRRQSRDRILIDDIINMVRGEKIVIAPYSESLFKDKSANTEVIGDPLCEASGDSWCFIEDGTLIKNKDKVDTLVIYRWNRHYPGDNFFDFPMDGYALSSSEELVGSSHDKITKEVWKK